MNVGNLMTNSIDVYPVAAVSIDGSPSYGAKQVVACRVEHGSKKVKDATGEVVDAEHVIVTNTEIAIDSRVSITGDSAGFRRIIKIKKASTPNGETLWELYL